MQIVLVSHGRLALGMKDTLELIVGPREDIKAFEAYEDGKGEDFIEEVRDIVEGTDERVIILTDLLGGSVNNEMTQLMLKNENVYLITGMNLPLVITLATYSGEINDDFVQELVNQGQQGVINIREYVKNAGKEDDDL